MATCKKINACYANQCLNQKPGIAEIYLINFEDLANVSTTATGSISGMTYDASLTGTSNWYSFEVQREVASLDNSNEINIQNSVSINRPKLSFKLGGLDQDQLDLTEVLAEGRVIAAFTNVSEEIMLIGVRNGLNATTLQQLNEAAANGFKGLNITLEGLNEKLYILDSTFATTFKTAHLHAC
jgi:hypothetical protein